MTLQELYENIEGDYTGVLQRLMNERLVAKFVRKFVDDKSYEELKQAMADQKIEESFRCAHTLKGVCANLGFTKLYEPSSALTEILRAGKTEGTGELFEKVTEEYQRTISAIQALN